MEKLFSFPEKVVPNVLDSFLNFFSGQTEKSSQTSHPFEYKLNLVERFAANVIKCGPIPFHVAYIMDGNRRFSRERKLGSIIQGHREGYASMTKMTSYCKAIGIREITVYVFSIENFKRSQEEVDSLMELIYEKLMTWWDARESIVRDGIRIRPVGHLKLLPPKIQRVGARLELYTKDCQEITLNFAVAYTSRVEMVEGINKLVSTGIPSDLVTENVFKKSWWSHEMSPVDLLIRTGAGDQSRLSDFLLWQTGYSVLYFTEATWPEFGFWQAGKALLNYQRHCDLINRARLKYEVKIMGQEENKNIKEVNKYLTKLNDDRVQETKWMAVLNV